MSQDQYKVFIPCAGTGSRLGSKTRHIAKALVTVAGKPAISHIIEKIPSDIGIVVGLGFKGRDLRDFLELAYPERKFEFVSVAPFEGPGSGLGLTLLAARNHLQCPFLFWSCDTLIDGLPKTQSDSWIASASLPKGRELHEFRCIETREDGKAAPQIKCLSDKGSHSSGSLPYIGLAFIREFEAFWESMAGGGEAAIAMGESFGLSQLISRGTSFRSVHLEGWFDTGALSGLEKANLSLQPEVKANILEKDNEAIWFIGDRAVKFNVDSNFIRNRVLRAERLKGFTPEILGQREHMYSYRLAQGEVLSHNCSAAEFEELLRWLTFFWREGELSSLERDEFRRGCDAFYQKKTYERVRAYQDRFHSFGVEGNLNGSSYPSISELLSRVPWGELSEGRPVRFHGDLHFENILRVADKNKFVLLDWRQDFAGQLEYGDLYYDLAKLHHGLIVSHGIVTAERYTVHGNTSDVTFNIDRLPELIECEEVLFRYVKSKGLSSRKLRILTPLIFLNIAALHHDPYGKFLFCLGRSMLSDALSSGKREH